MCETPKPKKSCKIFIEDTEMFTADLAIELQVIARLMDKGFYKDMKEREIRDACGNKIGFISFKGNWNNPTLDEIEKGGLLIQKPNSYDSRETEKFVNCQDCEEGFEYYGGELQDWQVRFIERHKGCFEKPENQIR